MLVSFYSVKIVSFFIRIIFISAYTIFYLHISSNFYFRCLDDDFVIKLKIRKLKIETFKYYVFLVSLS